MIHWLLSRWDKWLICIKWSQDWEFGKLGQGLTLTAKKHNFSCMKAVTINISLNPELAEFVKADSAARAFGSMSEYMRDLIRKRRQEAIDADVAYLEKCIE